MFEASDTKTTLDESLVSSLPDYICYEALKQIPKREQTVELIQRAISTEKDRPILNLVSSRLLTRSICLQAVKSVGENLKYVPEKLVDREICEAAVCVDGLMLNLVPKEYVDMVMCRLAVSNNGHALDYVPWLFRNKYLCSIAVKQDGLAVKYVPDEIIDEELAYYAVTNSYYGYWIKGWHGKKEHIERNVWPIKYIPSRVLTPKLVECSFFNNPSSLLFAPKELISEDFCLRVVKEDGCNLKYIPAEKKSRKIIEVALKSNPWALEYVPEKSRTYRRCVNARNADSNIPIDWFPEAERLKYMTEVEGKTNFDVIVKELPDTSLFLQEYLVDEKEVSDESLSPFAYLDNEESTSRLFYYVSDLHLEHQLELAGKHQKEVDNLIQKAVFSLVYSSYRPSEQGGILLIGGDTSNGLPIARIFYRYLCKLWNGTVVSVLGNHELWDFYNESDEIRTCDPIMADYRAAINTATLNSKQLLCRSFLLENDLLLYYFDEEWITLDEAEILHCSPERLRDLCSKSSIIILGGLGFTGNNPINNAALGYYGTCLTDGEDELRSCRFRAIYEKVLLCAKEKQVIVLTHTPMQDWSSARYNPNWVYVNGHTHSNRFIRDVDGTTVLSDNQIGYHPKRLALKSFSLSVRGRYNPFDDWGNGTYSITREQYLDFNRGSGINISSFKAASDVIMLKRDDTYMFFLQNEKLSILEGGRRRIASHDLQYYYDNLTLYSEQIRTAFRPYQTAICRLSELIKSIGGVGTRHGCIVDIDFFNHLYLNPIDGKITPYFALDMTQKIVYQDLKTLLAQSPIKPMSIDGNKIKDIFSEDNNDTVSKKLSAKIDELCETATVSQIVLDKEIYNASRIMRCLQYTFDQQVVRVWNDDVLLRSQMQPELKKKTETMQLLTNL